MKTISGENWTVWNGDCREAFAALPARSVHCIMTSPPYWGGIRDYGIPPAVWGGDPGCDHEWEDSTVRDTRKNDDTAGPKQRSNTGAVGHRIEKASDTCRKCGAWRGCYGNEPTVEQYVANTVEIFAVLGHALRDDGAIWWNIGDTYAASGRGGNPEESAFRKQATNVGSLQPRFKAHGIAAGNKCLVPFRVALALQDAGWIVRQDVIWRKPSPMPESIDGWRWERCRVKVAKSARSTYDRHVECDPNGKPHAERDGKAFADQSERFQECPGCPKCADHGGYVLRRGSWRPTTAHEFVFQIVKSPEYFCDAAAALEATTGNAHPQRRGVSQPKLGGTNTDFGMRLTDTVEQRNPRSVWSISSEAYKGKHFAAFPTMLAWKCIQASTSAGGCCAACGSQYAPVVEKGRIPTRPGNDTKVNGTDDAEHGNRDPQRHIAVKRTTGYRPTCDCNAGDPVPATVADPFTGSGTVLQVSINTGRRFVGSEIAEHYLPLIQERAETPWVPKTDKKPKAKRRKHHRRQLTLM